MNYKQAEVNVLMKKGEICYIRGAEEGSQSHIAFSQKHKQVTLSFETLKIQLIQ